MIHGGVTEPGGCWNVWGGCGGAVHVGAQREAMGGEKVGAGSGGNHKIGKGRRRVDRCAESAIDAEHNQCRQHARVL